MRKESGSGYIGDCAAHGSAGEETGSGAVTPAFISLFEESVLLSLLEQGVLKEEEFLLCLDQLTCPGGKTGREKSREAMKEGVQ